MSNNRANTASEFRTILTRIVEIKNALQESNHGEIAKQLGEFNDSLRIIEGNQAEFSDAIFKSIEKIQETMENGFKAIEARIVALEAKIDQDVATQADSVGSWTPSPNSSGRKRKISRHPDLSHYIRSKMDQLGLSWNTDMKENEDPNRAVSTTLLQEVKEVEQIKNDQLCTERRILDAISQNYASSKKRKRQEENGTYEKYQQEQKRRQRIKRKLEKRLKVVNEEEKEEEIFGSLHISLVSSDESEDEGDALVTRPLTWRVEEVSDFFKTLDDRWKAAMTPQQKRQSVSRRNGLPSLRSPNGVPRQLVWAVRSL